MKQHSQQKPAAQRAERKTDEQQTRGAAGKRAEADRAERISMQHGTGQSAKRPMRVPAEDSRGTAQEGQMPQNQQRLGQHQNSRKQP
ncbi:hypothetical protein LMG7141_03066 [Ralstonia condita]|uniref:Uncharacterized protein n=1 Tax=Ralstonia condita TaxID=3058600 RepID=A0ABM9JJ76_9RALS|nr:hypothetical protein [Ralstonia sp. LMG 7141]CAJ0795263.1 hypothetical protein LMG7141_03066 [Ralstonia sp. LMG 7141]